MANRVQTFFQGLIGVPNQKAPSPSSTPARPLVPFGDFAPWQFGYTIPDWSLQQQIEEYSGWVFDCVTKIAQEFAAINLKLFKMDSDGDIEEMPTHPSLDLIDRVNKFTTFYDLKELTVSYLELTGNAYWWLLRNKAGDIIEIYPWLRPDRMVAVPSVEDFIKEYRYNLFGQQNPVIFETSEIIHFKYFNPKDPYVGVSPTRSAQLAILTDKFAAQYNRDFFTNNARPDGVLSFEDGIDQDQAKRVLEKWSEQHSQGQSHRLAILSKGKYQQVAVTQKDMDFIGQRNFSRDEILAAFKVPKSLLGITEDVNYATAEAARKMFLKQVVVPKMEKFVQYLNEFLLPQFKDGDSLFFDYDNPVPEDQELKLAYYDAGIKGGWLSPNEVRVREGLDPYLGGENIYIPFNVVPGGSTDQTVTVKAFHMGKVKDIRVPRKFNIRVRSRSERAKKEALIAEALKTTGLAKKLAGSFRPKDETSQKKSEIVARKDLFGDSAKLQLIWQKVWEMKISKTDNQERLFLLMLRREFNRQRDAVLKSMQQKAQKDIGFDFNVDQEKDIFVRIFQPLVIDIVKEHGNDALELLGRGGFDTTQNIKNYLKSDGLKFAKEVNDVTKQALKDQIAEGIEKGEAYTKIKDRVSSVFKEASDARANSIARTEVARSSNFGTLEGFKQSGVVTYTEWFTAQDESVCPLCAPMHGKKSYLDSSYFDKGDSYLGKDDKSIDFSYSGIDAGTLHVNCRCILIPHTDEADFFDKEKSQEVFDLKGFEGSDATANRNAAEQVNQLFAKHGPELAKYGDRFDWKLQYTDINELDYGIAGDEARVTAYIEAMRKGDKFPAITAQVIGDTKATVLDGAHRLEALKRLGARIIPVVVGRVPKK